MPNTIAWVWNRFDRMGGGERLIQEGARYYRSIGDRVFVFTWHYDDEVLFNGEYEKRDIVDLGGKEIDRGSILKRAWSRAMSLPRLRAELKRRGVKTVFVQGEYDVALVYLALLGSGIRYRFLIFGQMFQYPHDNGKYALIFRRHLATIVNSCRGYRDTIPLNAPKLSLPNRIANELICVVRWFAVRGAEKRFTFSRQIDWETGLLFDAKTIRARGAFRRELLTANIDSSATLSRFGLTPERYLLSISRLDRKKRIDVIIRAFAKANLPADMVMVVGGGGDDRPFLEQTAREAGVINRVKFIGRVDEQDLLPLKQACAVFLSMDIGDYDISPLEALALGRPVICPTEFDVEENDTLAACPSFHICEATTESLAEELASVLATPQETCRDELGDLSWESYYDTLMRQ